MGSDQLSSLPSKLADLGQAERDRLGALAQQLVFGFDAHPSIDQIRASTETLTLHRGLISEAQTIVASGSTKEFAVEMVLRDHTREGAWRSLLDQVRVHFNLDDPYILEFVLSSLATLPMPGDPVWGFIVGPPSGLKTEILRWLTGLPCVYSTSRLTPHSLVSGLKDGRSLLPDLDGKTLVIKDFTTILEMDRKAREEIFAQLRDAYDGYYEGFYGSVGKLSFSAHFNVLAAVTPAIEEYYSLQSFLGPRFLKVRAPTPDGFDRSLEEAGTEPDVREKLSSLVRRVVESIDAAAWKGVVSTRVRVVRPVVEALARGRTHVSRSDGVISQVPEPEAVPRLTKQLKKLAIGRALLYGRCEVDDSDLRFVRRVALDTMPRVRAMILTALRTPGTIDEVSREVGLPTRTIYRHLEDLEVLRLVSGDGERSPRPETFYLETQARHLVTPHTVGEAPREGIAKEVGGGQAL